MHTTPHRPTCSASPTSTIKWKRGRPVSPWGSFARPVYQGSNSGDKNAHAVQCQDSEASAVAAMQRLQLWDLSKPIHFAPTTHEGVKQAAVTESNSQVENQAEVNGQDSSQLFRNSQLTADKRAQHSAGDQLGGETGQSTYEDSSFDNETTTTEETEMEYSTDSDYMVDQDRNSLLSQESTTDIVEHENDTADEEEDGVEEHVPLSYQIPKDVLRAAMEATPNTRASYWSTKFYRGPQEEPVLIHYCKSMDVADRVAQYFLEEKVLGFDIEWKPQLHRRLRKQTASSIKENASLIQLASENRIALFHIALFPGRKVERLMPPNLRTVLESPDIIKVGVAVKNDFSRLQTYLGIQPQGVFELSRLHNLVTWYESNPSKVSKKLVGLGQLVHEHLQLPLYKGTPLDDEPDVTSSVRTSDWSQALSLDQIHYAAADSYAGFRLYDVLEEKRKKLRPTPSAIELCDGDPKPDSRCKEQPKKKKRVVKPKTITEAETNQAATTEEQDDRKMEESDDTEGYDTAPEELMDSHQLENSDPSPEPPSEMKDGQEMVQSHKRVGRVSLSWLRGPDPEYPVLPQSSSEDHGVSLSQEANATSDISPSSSLHEKSRNMLFEQDAGSESDEFADPELENALRNMDFDGEGKLVFSPGGPSLGVKLNQEGQLDLGSLSTGQGARNEIDKCVLEDTSSTPTFESLIGEASEVVHSAEYTAATVWAQAYLHSNVPSPKSTAPTRIRATVPHLRAYHMSIHQKLSLDEIAKHLRDPPLSLSTVAGYILQTISLERLEYDKEQLKDVMMVLPSNIRQGRWKWLAEKVGALHEC